MCTYIIDFDDSWTGENLESVQPNKEIGVRVRQEMDATSASIFAKGTLNEGRTVFSIVATTSMGEESHVCNYSLLEDKLRSYWG